MRMSCPASSMCVAKEWRRQWAWTDLTMSDLIVAFLRAFCRMLSYM